MKNFLFVIQYDSFCKTLVPVITYLVKKNFQCDVILLKQKFYKRPWLSDNILSLFDNIKSDLNSFNFYTNRKTLQIVKDKNYDVITIGITASEDLINSGSTLFGGNIAGLSFNTRAGADATQWEFYNTVSTHAEQVVTYSVVYYDANYNVGASNITTTTDGSTTLLNKQSSAYAKSQKGGSTELKQRASERSWNIMPSSDLNSNISKTLSNNGFKGIKDVSLLYSSLFS